MINQDSLSAIEASPLHPSLCRPCYTTYSFSNIPGTTAKLLGISSDLGSLPSNCYVEVPGGYPQVVVILIDALGWGLLQEYLASEEASSLTPYFQSGTLSKISSLFPSTTSNCITHLLSSVPLTRSGVLEWYYYNARLDEIINPFKIGVYPSLVAEELREQVDDIIPEPEFGHLLREADVQWHAYLPRQFLESSYNIKLLSQAKSHGYDDRRSGLKLLSEQIVQGSSPAYHYLYLPELDAHLHDVGPAAPSVRAMLAEIMSDIANEFLNPIAESSHEVALVLTADHGQIAFETKDTVLLDRELPELLPLLKRTKSGRPTTPSGGPRDTFLHVIDGAEKQALDLLREHLDGKAVVIETSALVQDHYFGLGTPAPNFLKNLGQIAILPTDTNTVYWSKGDYSFEEMPPGTCGHHGGLSREEMESFFFFLIL